MLQNDTEMFDTSKKSPVFYGYSYKELGPLSARVEVLENEDANNNVNEGQESEPEKERNSKDFREGFESDKTHVACFGFKLVKKSDVQTEEKKAPPQRIEKFEKAESIKKLPAREYLQEEVFPVLMPALEAMLASAKDNNVLRWKRTKFNACDYLTEYLYNNNPNSINREKTGLWEIPFVKRINDTKPRPPLPLSLIWTEDEAAIVLQSCWRGRKVRSDPEVQELRQYQKEMREQEYDIMLKIEDFWKKHPVEEANETATEEGTV